MNKETEKELLNQKNGIFHIDGAEYNVDEEKLKSFIDDHFIDKRELMHGKLQIPKDDIHKDCIPKSEVNNTLCQCGGALHTDCVHNDDIDRDFISRKKVEEAIEKTLEGWDKAEPMDEENAVCLFVNDLKKELSK